MQRMKHLGLLALLAAVEASGNDTVAALRAGGLIPKKTAHIRLVSENLDISLHEIKIRYIFKNTSDHDVDEIVAFPLPQVEGGLFHNESIGFQSKRTENFMDFRVSENGKPIMTHTQMRASDGKRDITERLRSLSLPLSVLADKQFKIAYARLPKSEQERLVKEGIVAVDDGDAGQGPMNIAWANWTTSIQYYWQQHFPANGTVELFQTYRPVVGGEFVGSDNSDLKDYCGKPIAEKYIMKVAPGGPNQGFVSGSLLEYILTTANNWKGSIGAFHLTIRTDKAGQPVMTCSLPLKKTNSTTYEFERSDFRPTKELKLMFLGPLPSN